MTACSKLKPLKLYLVSPAARTDPGAAAELATLTTRMDSTYSSGKFQLQGQDLTLNDAGGHPGREPRLRPN